MVLSSMSSRAWIRAAVSPVGARHETMSRGGKMAFDGLYGPYPHQANGLGVKLSTIPVEGIVVNVRLPI